VELIAPVEAKVAGKDESPGFALDFPGGHGAAPGFLGTFWLDGLVEKVLGGLGEALVWEFGLAEGIVVREAVGVIANEVFPGVWMWRTFAPLRH